MAHPWLALRGRDPPIALWGTSALLQQNVGITGCLQATLATVGFLLEHFRVSLPHTALGVHELEFAHHHLGVRWPWAFSLVWAISR